eukprot:scaffold118_cov382-Prasinococcus_capsulatus_cf.AAC.6
MCPMCAGTGRTHAYLLAHTVISAQEGGQQSAQLRGARGRLRHRWRVLPAANRSVPNANRLRCEGWGPATVETGSTLWRRLARVVLLWRRLGVRPHVKCVAEAGAGRSWQPGSTRRRIETQGTRVGGGEGGHRRRHQPQSRATRC